MAFRKEELNMKCIQPDCCRDAARMFHGGRKTRGRPKKDDPTGLPLCSVHYEEARGRPSVKRSIHNAAVEQCAAIADVQGQATLANLLRKLKTGNKM